MTFISKDCLTSGSQAPQCPEGPGLWTTPKLPTASHIVPFYGGENSVGWMAKYTGKVISQGRDSFGFSLEVTPF